MGTEMMMKGKNSDTAFEQGDEIFLLTAVERGIILVIKEEYVKPLLKTWLEQVPVFRQTGLLNFQFRKGSQKRVKGRNVIGMTAGNDQYPNLFRGRDGSIRREISARTEQDQRHYQ